MLSALDHLLPIRALLQGLGIENEDLPHQMDPSSWVRQGVPLTYMPVCGPLPVPLLY